MGIDRLTYLVNQVGGMGGAVTIKPVVETGKHLLSAPIEGPSGGTYGAVVGWAITFETPNGNFTVTGKTLGQAAHAALANPDAW